MKKYIKQVQSNHLTSKLMQPAKILVPLLCLSAPMSNALAADIFVAQNGDDQDVGTITTPLASIQAALNKAQAGDTIYLREGRYYEAVNFTGQNGNSGSPITITAYNNEEAVIDGSESLADLDGNTWTTLTSNPNIYKTTINKDVWQLWVDERMQIVARWPNYDPTTGHPTEAMQLKANKIDPKDKSWWDMSGTWGHMTSTLDEQDNNNGTHTLTSDSYYQDLAGENVSFAGGSIILNYHSETQFSRNITSHAAGSNDITHESVINPWDKNQGYFMVEAKGALDQPGEWYYDKSTGEVWLWPEDGQSPAGKNIRGKTQSYAMDLAGTSFVTLKGLKFFGTTIKCEADCNNITLEDNKFFYPTWFKRILGEHSYFGEDKETPSAGSEAGDGATILKGNNYLIKNNEFAYSDGMIDMNAAGSNNHVINNLFHHWSFTGMSQMLFKMNSNEDSTFSRNTMHTNGSKVMLKHGRVDVTWSRAYQWGYFQQDGVAFQCKGGNGYGGSSDGVVRERIWVHNAKKGASRWDGSDGVNGTDQYQVAINVPSHSNLKGDDHSVYNNLALWGEDPSFPMTKLNDENGAGTEERNTITRVYNNLSEGISGNSHEYVPLITPYQGTNWNAFVDQTGFDDTIASRLRDPANFDFRPKATATDIIDTGTVIAGATDGFIGSAPDIGPYEFGDTHYWIPGFQAKDTALTPVPSNLTTTAQPTADLMWLAAREAAGHKVYFGTNPSSLAEIANITNPENNIVSPGSLTAGVTYYWRVDTVLADASVVTGEQWQFSVSEPITVSQEKLIVSADTYVDSFNNTKNYDSASTVYFRVPQTPETKSEQIAYVKFDLAASEVDFEAVTILNATLRLHRKDGGANVQGVKVYAMTDSGWESATVTWDNKPEKTDLLKTGDIFSGLWGHFNVTAGMVNNGTVSFAISREMQDSTRGIDSKESAFAPELLVDYTTDIVDTRPAAPDPATITANDNSVTLNWTAVNEADVVGYNVYRRQNHEDFFVSSLNPAVLDASTLTLTDDTLLIGLPYQYVVRAIDEAGQESYNTTILAVTLVDNDADGMTDSWEENNGLDSTVNDAELDPDGDGLSNLDEFKAGSDPQSGGTTETLFTDDFESGNADQWSTTGTVAIISAAKNTGSKGARLKNSSSMQLTLDTSAVTGATLTYDRRTAGYDAGEFLLVEYSTDGSNWVVMEQTLETTYTTVSFSLPSSTNLQVRFVTNADKNTERAEVDNVQITGM